MYLVIAVFYTSSALLPSIVYIIKNTVAFTKGISADDEDSTKKSTKKDEKETKSKLFLVLLRETFIIIVCVLVCVLCIYTAVFFYLFSTTEITFTDNFKNTLTFLEKFLWRGGNLLPIYIPFIASIFVVFLVMSFYIAGNKEFVRDLAYANNDNTETDIDEYGNNVKDTIDASQVMVFYKGRWVPQPTTDEEVEKIENAVIDNNGDADTTNEINLLKNAIQKKSKSDKDNKDDTNTKTDVDEDVDVDATDDPNLDTTLRIPGMDVSKSEMFRRYLMLMIMLIGLFILMLMFIHFWDTDKASFVMYTTFLMILMICAIVSTKGRYWTLTFYVALATCAAINYYSIIKSTEK
jgi:cation transport ATPase